MSITVKSVCCDTGNFFRNQFFTILSIALLCACVTTMINYAFLPSEEQMTSLKKSINLINRSGILEIIKNISSEQRQILLRVSITLTFSGIISNTVLVGSTLIMIQRVSLGWHINVFQAIWSSFSILRKLFILIFFITFLIQTGIILVVIPGILTAVVLAFAPVILINSEINILSAMRDSINLAWNNIFLISPAIVFWFLLRTLLWFFSPYLLNVVPNIGTVIVNTLSNLISAALLVYVYRVFMLIRK